MYERTSPPGEDSGAEPLIAVCATAREADQVKEASSVRSRYASWEEFRLQGAADRTGPLADGETVHIVLLGGGEPDPERDPIGVAVFTDRDAADRCALDERRRSGDPGYHAISLPIGWRAADH
ncbi:hypothetical protein [Actinomadura terrae]|uniref:hypothetical protein n=1 Tax=Actinomadura terrae TaxID=604353 RepID=UPI001FA7D327|nr:hypothetical protein [Actinomadura terrae]